MSFIKIIEKNIATPAIKKSVETSHLSNSTIKSVTQELSTNVQNLTQLLKEVEPESFTSIQKYLKRFERYGFSQGDIKYLTQQNPEFIHNLKLITDKKLIEALTKRKNLVKNGLLSNITEENKNSFIKLLNDKNITDEEFSYISHLIKKDNVSILKQFLKDKNFDSKILADVPATHLTKDNAKVLKAIGNKGNVKTQEMIYIMGITNKSNSDIALKLLERAGENTDGINSILHNVYAFEGMSKEGLQTFQLRKNFINELLKNPDFQLGKNEMENFNISQILLGLTPDNYEFAKQALIKRNVKLNQLPDFIKGVTQKNQAVAERILGFASKDTVLPNIESLNPEIATKYLDEIAKINNPEAQSLYIEVIESLNEQNINEVLKLIRTTKPEKAKRTSAIINSLNHSSIDEIEPIINLFEQNGRQLDNSIISNLTVLNNLDDIPVSNFIERLAKNKTINDNEIGILTEKYVQVAKKFNPEDISIPTDIYRKINEGKISATEVEELITKLEQEQTTQLNKLPDILEKLYQNKNLTPSYIADIFSNISPDNFSVVEKYALTPEITRIDISASKSKYMQEIEHLLKTDVPRFEHKHFFNVLKLQDKGGEKRFEILQDLIKREKNPDYTNITNAISKIDEKTLPYIDEIVARKDLTPEQISLLLDHIQNGGDVKNLIKLLKNKDIESKYLQQILEGGIPQEMFEQYPELVKKASELKVPLIEWDFSKSKDVPITDIISEKKLTNILEGIEKAKDKYGIIPSNLSFSGKSADDLFIVLKDTNKSLTYKFNKKTGSLVSVTEGNRTIHAKTGEKIYDSVASEETKIPQLQSKYRISTVAEGKDKNLKTLYTESAINGQYDIFQTRPDGSTIRIGHAQITPNGAKHIRRTLTSTDGSKTYTAFREDKLGNSYMHSVITDKTGKQISEVKRTFKVISKNHFISTVNDKSYDIAFKDRKIIVTKLDSMGKKTSEKVEYAITDTPVDVADNIFKEIEAIPDTREAAKQITSTFKKYGIEPKVIDKSCVEMLKRLPGDEWFAMNKSCDFVMPQSNTPSNAMCGVNSIFMSKELNNNLGVFAHELGHAKFFALDLGKDKELMKIYNAEKKAYTARFPESRIDSIDYFLSGNNPDKRGLNETCAETNLMTDTIQSWEPLQDRTIFLEQFFPNTIAYIRGKFSTLM